MKEEQVFFKAGLLRLEGLYAPPKAGEDGTAKGVVISHPHPQMGGCMENNVVESMVVSFHRHGYSTLRFNFRGVGLSEGSYDEGRGEQDDIGGAVEFLRDRGIGPVLLAGYSFGAWISAKVLAAADGGFLPAVFVAPPVRLFEFDRAAIAGKIGLAVCGDHDEFCALPSVRALAADTGCRLEVIRDADHFFFDKEHEIVRILGEYLAVSRGRSPF